MAACTGSASAACRCRAPTARRAATGAWAATSPDANRPRARSRRLAFYDALTGLPNRRLLLDRLQHATVAVTRSNTQGALLFIDLDNFKSLNDTLGHDAGDHLLQQAAQRLKACVREVDTVARFGGDEFVVLLAGLSAAAAQASAEAAQVAKHIAASLGQPYALGGAVHHSTPSIGIALFGPQACRVDELLKQADLAMYQAKAAGRNTQRFFDPEMQAAASHRSALEADLRRGLQQRELVLHYQPMVDGQGRLQGAEALVRWNHPQRGLMPPAEFTPLAEQTGLILPLGQWVLETACAQLVAWSRSALTRAFSLSVNVSVRQFRQVDFVQQLLATLEASGANPERLTIELTESLLLNDVQDIIARMQQLRCHGLGFALDDFGTGYSSLSQLKRLPLDQIKIDRSFVRDLPPTPATAPSCAASWPWPRAWAWPWWPKGWRPGRNWSFCSTMAARHSRATTSAARCRPKRWRTGFRWCLTPSADPSDRPADRPARQALLTG